MTSTLSSSTCSETESLWFIIANFTLSHSVFTPAIQEVRRTSGRGEVVRATTSCARSPLLVLQGAAQVWSLSLSHSTTLCCCRSLEAAASKRNYGLLDFWLAAVCSFAHRRGVWPLAKYLVLSSLIGVVRNANSPKKQHKRRIPLMGG